MEPYNIGLIYYLGDIYIYIYIYIHICIYLFGSWDQSAGTQINTQTQTLYRAKIQLGLRSLGI